MSADAIRSVGDEVRRMNPVAAQPKERDAVAALSQFFDKAGGRQRRPEVWKLVGPSGDEAEIPESVFSVLELVAEVLARGDSITVVPVGKELTSQQAADILNVSRQYLVRLLDRGCIPFTKAGRHRRVRVEDVLGFKKKRDRERRERLDALAQISDAIGGYDELG